MLSYHQCDPMFGHLWSIGWSLLGPNVFKGLQPGCLAAGISKPVSTSTSSARHAGSWQCHPLTMTKTYKTKEQRALQTDSICVDLCWHQITSKSTNLQSWRHWKKKKQLWNNKTQHRNTTTPWSLQFSWVWYHMQRYRHLVADHHVQGFTGDYLNRQKQCSKSLHLLAWWTAKKQQKKVLHALFATGNLCYPTSMMRPITSWL